MCNVGQKAALVLGSGKRTSKWRPAIQNDQNFNYFISGPRFGVQKMDAQMAAVFGEIFGLLRRSLFGSGATTRWVKQAANL